LQLVFTFSFAGEIDVSGALEDYTKYGSTGSRPQEAMQARK
jgi:hypothetical protein